MPLNAGNPKAGLRGPPSTQHQNINGRWELPGESATWRHISGTGGEPSLPTCEMQGAFLQDFPLQLLLQCLKLFCEQLDVLLVEDQSWHAGDETFVS